MRLLRTTGFLAAFLGFAAGAFAQAQATPEELRSFLGRLGFEDHVAIMRDYRERGLLYNDMNRRQQDQNMTSYETINVSRELAISILSELGSRLNDPATRKNLIEFTAKMLALKPLPPRTDYPAAVMALPEGDERTKAVNDWLAGKRREQMETHTRQIVSDIAGLLYGTELSSHSQELGRIYGLVSTIVDRTYMDTLIGQTRFFGRALTLLLARQEKVQKDEGLLKDLSKELLSKYQMHLQNFLGRRWVIDTSSGPVEKVVENGTMLGTRNLSAESLQISFAAVPSLPETHRRARELGLIGKMRSSPFFVTPEDAAEGLNWAGRVKDAIQQWNIPMSAGLSHIGYVVVLKDPQTGIEMSYTIDNYPQIAADSSEILANPGGVRFTGLEQMLDASHHSKIAIGQIDHVKFYEWAHEAAQVLGYPKDGVIFDSSALEMQDGQPVITGRAPREAWQIQISKEEYDRLNGIGNIDRWYETVSNAFVSKGLKDLWYRGIYFQWVSIGAYVKGGAYCSQTGLLAWAQATGIPIERLFSEGRGAEYLRKLEDLRRQHPGFRPSDGWSWQVRLLASIGRFAERLKSKGLLPKISEGILNNGAVKQALMFIKMDIVAPSGQLAQPHVNTEVLDLKDRPLNERVALPYRKYKEKDPALTAQVEQLLPRSDARFQRHLNHEQNPSEIGGAAMRDIEYRMGIYGYKGKKTEGIGVDIVARIGSEQAMVRARQEWEERGRPHAVAPSCRSVHMN